MYMFTGKHVYCTSTCIHEHVYVYNIHVHITRGRLFLAVCPHVQTEEPWPGVVYLSVWAAPGAKTSVQGDEALGPAIGPHVRDS